MAPHLYWWNPRTDFPDNELFVNFLDDPTLLQRYYPEFERHLRDSFSKFAAVQHLLWPEAENFLHKAIAKRVTELTRHAAGRAKHPDGQPIPISNYSWVPFREIAKAARFRDQHISASLILSVLWLDAFGKTWGRAKVSAHAPCDPR